ncbi:MAG: cytochrome c [Rhodocyclaceae bacterium]|nr:cytochrome c [Rhodocyclaceae bacterium]MCB1901052.1 cytochrome c [Rhodocyclaceae bacterium]MCP5310429.1 cytochrome c [Zoogloeaceae bacterium]
MYRKPFAILLCALALAGCNSEPEDTRPGQPVAHRRAAFKEIIKAFEPMGVMMRTDSYDAAKFKVLTAQLMARRDVPWQYFTADTLYPPSHARAEVWSEADRFAADKKAFFDATDALARVVDAAGGAPDEVTARNAYRDVEAACENCHKTFKRR